MQKGGGGGRSRRRPLKHGDLRLLILALIGEQPRHGYDLITEIEQRTGGAYKPSPGVMYPALDVIQDMGLAKAKKQDGKRVFYLTEAGEAELAEQAEAVANIQSRLEALNQPTPDSEPGDIRTAMRRLRHTVFKAVTEAWPDTSNHEQITAILTKARADIADLVSKPEAD